MPDQKRTYRVAWTIDIDAADEAEAAQQALTIQRDAGSEATVFQVHQIGTDDLPDVKTVDLNGGRAWNEPA